MSLALPLFQDLTKAAQDVLYGNVQGEGVFTTGAQVKSQTMTAGVLPSPASLAEKVTPPNAASRQRSVPELLVVLGPLKQQLPNATTCRVHPLHVQLFLLWLGCHADAGGIILNSSTKLALGQGVCAPSLTVMATPNKSLMVMGIFDSTGSVTGAQVWLAHQFIYRQVPHSMAGIPRLVP